MKNRDLITETTVRNGDTVGLLRVVLIVSLDMLIGVVTALWRSSGTIAFFLYYGLQGIAPPLFVLMAFLLTTLLSFMLGTSFGVIGTGGVILITLARSGGVDLAITAGAIISGAYSGGAVQNARRARSSPAPQLAPSTRGWNRPESR